MSILVLGWCGDWLSEILLDFELNFWSGKMIPWAILISNVKKSHAGSINLISTPEKDCNPPFYFILSKKPYIMKSYLWNVIHKFLPTPTGMKFPEFPGVPRGDVGYSPRAALHCLGGAFVETTCEAITGRFVVEYQKKIAVWPDEMRLC